MALLALAGPVIAACGSRDAHPLSANPWVLTDAVDHGVPVDVTTETVWRFLATGCGGWNDSLADGASVALPTRTNDCPDGRKLIGNNVCNDFVRSVEFESDTVVFGEFRESTTLVCGDDLAYTLDSFLSAESFRYTIADEQLRLVSSDGSIVLTFQPSLPA